MQGMSIPFVANSRILAALGLAVAKGPKAPIYFFPGGQEKTLTGSDFSVSGAVWKSTNGQEAIVRVGGKLDTTVTINLDQTRIKGGARIIFYSSIVGTLNPRDWILVGGKVVGAFTNNSGRNPDCYYLVQVRKIDPDTKRIFLYHQITDDIETGAVQEGTLYTLSARKVITQQVNLNDLVLDNVTVIVEFARSGRVVTEQVEYDGPGFGTVVQYCHSVDVDVIDAARSTDPSKMGLTMNHVYSGRGRYMADAAKYNEASLGGNLPKAVRINGLIDYQLDIHTVSVGLAACVSNVNIASQIRYHISDDGCTNTDAGRTDGNRNDSCANSVSRRGASFIYAGCQLDATAIELFNAWDTYAEVEVYKDREGAQAGDCGLISVKGLSKRVRLKIKKAYSRNDINNQLVRLEFYDWVDGETQTDITIEADIDTDGTGIQARAPYSRTVSSITYANGDATITFTEDTKFVAGSPITVFNADQSALNGDFPVKASSNNGRTVTYTPLSDPGVSVATGDVRCALRVNADLKIINGRIRGANPVIVDPGIENVSVERNRIEMVVNPSIAVSHGVTLNSSKNKVLDNVFVGGDDAVIRAVTSTREGNFVRNNWSDNGTFHYGGPLAGFIAKDWAGNIVNTATGGVTFGNSKTLRLCTQADGQVYCNPSEVADTVNGGWMLRKSGANTDLDFGVWQNGDRLVQGPSVAPTIKGGLIQRKTWIYDQATATWRREAAFTTFTKNQSQVTLAPGQALNVFLTAADGVAGVRRRDTVTWGYSTSFTAPMMVSATATDTNVICIRITNDTGASQTINAGTFYVNAFPN